MFNPQTYRADLTKVTDRVRENLAQIRTGRATAALIENLPVTTYGGQATLRIMELATITNGGPQELIVIPFDQSVTQDIEKKLREASVGFSISVEGSQIRAKVPPLSEEQRQKYVKLVSQNAEEGREALRKLRDEERKKIKTAFEAKTLSEDQKFREEEQVEKVTKEFSAKLDELKSRKEQEVMSI